jgi:hypothetical protein
MFRKYLLDPSKTLEYFSDRIDGGNILSKILQETIELDSGVFFTLVADGSDLEGIYEFKYGGFLPQNPIIKYLNNAGQVCSYSEIPTIDAELSQLIFNVMQNNTVSCLFDDITREPTDRSLHDSIDTYKYVSGNEVYYLLNQQDSTAEKIRLCLRTSNAFWHSLCVLSSAAIHPANRTLSESMFKELCMHAQLVFVGAYDREGYVFWERNGSDLFGQQLFDVERIEWVNKI